jgi:hypothetical protein
MILGRKKLTAKNLWKRKIFLGGWVGGVASSAEAVLRRREGRLRCWEKDFALRVQHNSSARNYMQMPRGLEDLKLRQMPPAMRGRLLTAGWGELLG